MVYAELHAKTNFSFLEGASHPDELVCRAAELGYAALAVTDRNSLAGVVRAHAAAKNAGLKLIVGAEIAPEDALPVVLWVTDRAAYGRLARLITRGCTRDGGKKGECRLCFDDIAEHSDGLLAGVVPESSSFILHPSSLASYRAVFGRRCWLLAELHQGPDDRRHAARLSEISRKSGLPLVAAGDVHYHVRDRGVLHDVLVATGHGCTVAAAGTHRFANHQRYLKPLDEIAGDFAWAEAALRQTVEIAGRCSFSLDQLRYEYPEELAPRGETPIAYLVRRAWAGARKRYPQGIPEKVRGLLEHELRLIEELHYEAYFLTVWDLVRFARRRGILCQGRGSAANSAVCYCLGITAVNPERMDLLFERFISRERNEAPDIDVDFEHERREEVLQYIYRKYGREHSGITAEVITYRGRSAVRDVGRALGMPPEQLGALAKSLDHMHRERGTSEGDSPIFDDHRCATVPAKIGTVPECEAASDKHATHFAAVSSSLAERCREVGIDPTAGMGRQLVALAGELIGFPRHLSQHTGGMVVTRGPLCELVPIENAAMPGRTVIQWNKDDLDELGILKVDCLALGMLTAIRKAFALVRQHSGRRLTLASIPEGDPAVYAMICRADTMGVFQIESRAQMSMLPRLRPERFYDLVIEVAIVRPGPIQGNMVHPYLRRRNGEEAVTYPSEAIRGVLEKTLGVPLFQEQAMRLAVVAAGFTPGEADQLRRAMGAWRRPGLIDEFRRRLIEGMLARGLSREYAEAVFRQIRGFGDYGFPESHAASFALLVYVSAWLKCHEPGALAAALLNSQPMGFYAPAQLVRNVREHGVEVRPVDVNTSDWDCTLEKSENGQVPFSSAIRLGFRMLQGMIGRHAGQIEQVRGDRPFTSIEDFSRRTGLGRAAVVRLAKAGAFGSLGLDRRGALWHALAQEPCDLPLFAGLSSDDGPAVGLPRMSAAEEVLADYRTAGLSLVAHPLQFLREELGSLGAVPAAALATMDDGAPVCVAGLVLVRQRPGTAKGITFVTLEDETGVANLIIRLDVWNRYRQVASRAAILLVRGRLQRHGLVVHVLAAKLEDVSDRLRGLDGQSRDFR